MTMPALAGGDVWALSWSGGKDSALALDRAVRAGLDVRYLLTLYDPATGRVRFHGASPAAIAAQAAALGREALLLPAPWDRFEDAFGQGLDALTARDVAGLIFGNIHLADVRAWYEARVAARGLRHHEPLWGESPAALVREVVDRGYVARLSCVDATRLPRAWLGRALDRGLLAELQGLPGVDPCGERGEYHTLVSDGPLFARPAPLRFGPPHEEGAFVWLESGPMSGAVTPCTESSPRRSATRPSIAMRAASASPSCHSRAAPARLAARAGRRRPGPGRRGDHARVGRRARRAGPA